ncbi:MAG: GAF domain-containing protein [Chloroflexota bacterium]
MGRKRVRPFRRVDRDVQAIGALTQAVLDGDDLEQLLDRIAGEARVLADAVSGVVVTVSDAGEMTFRGVAGLNIGPLRVGHVMPVRDTLTEVALTKAANIVARDASEIPLAGRAFAAATGMGPLIAAPLAQIGSARGVLVVARTADSPPFVPADISLVSTFAAQAASAIELFELRSAQRGVEVRDERLRIAGELHDGVVSALRDLQAGVLGLADGSDDGRLAVGIGKAVAQLDDAIETIGGYVVELRRAAPRAEADQATLIHPPTRPSRPNRPTPAPEVTGRARDQTIAVIGELARTAARDTPTDEILQTLIDEIVERAEARYGLVGTLSEDGFGIFVRTLAGADLPGRRVGDTIPIGDTAAGEAIALGRPVVVSSIAESTITSSLPAAVKKLIGPMVSVPLVIRDRRFGVMAIGRSVGAAPFTESQVRLIEAYGVQAAIALEFERVRRGLRSSAISAERDRIGRDLQERVIQLLFGVALALQALGSNVPDSSVRVSLQAAVEGLDRAIRDLRRFVFGLGPGPVEDPRIAERLESLAADNARLQAEIEAQLHEVKASRTRIIAAGDAERKRVERDLHDGAQQRLVSLTLALRLARVSLGDDLHPSAKLSLDQASADAKAALSELRELARGIHPQILTHAGLGPAIDSLAARSPVDVRVEIGATRFSPVIEGAVYFTVSEALTNIAKYAEANSALVRVAWGGDQLILEIADDGIGGADPASGTGLRGLADRLASIDGSLEVVSPVGGGTRLLARIPAPAAIAAPA